MRNIKEPIDIDIEDNGKYADVALYIDRESVINDIYVLRKEWIGSSLVNNREIIAFINRDRNSQEATRFWEYYLKARKLVIEHGVAETFFQPFVSAVLSGQITDNDYSAILKEFINYHLPEEYQFNHKVVLSSDRVRKPDWKKIRGKLDTKAKATIKRDRLWYWEHKHSGYKSIAKKYDQDMFTVRSSIVSYQSRLK